MSFMRWIIDRLSDASYFFYDIGLQVNSWVWPFWYAAGFFFALSYLFADLAWDFVDFAEWLEWVFDELGAVLTWSYIQELIRNWLPDLEYFISWIPGFDAWLDSILEDWTNWIFNTWQTIIDGVSLALTNLKAEWDNFWNITWPQWVDNFNDLKAKWDNFWITIFPNLVDFTWLGIWWNSRLADIQGLIDSAFVLRESLWAGWQDWRDSVAEFFADPLEWLWTRFADWFLGTEE